MHCTQARSALIKSRMKWWRGEAKGARLLAGLFAKVEFQACRCGKAVLGSWRHFPGQLPSIKEVLGAAPLKAPYKEEARKDMPRWLPERSGRFLEVMRSCKSGEGNEVSRREPAQWSRN